VVRLFPLDLASPSRSNAAIDRILNNRVAGEGVPLFSVTRFRLVDDRKWIYATFPYSGAPEHIRVYTEPGLYSSVRVLCCWWWTRIAPHLHPPSTGLKAEETGTSASWEKNGGIGDATVAAMTALTSLKNR
jgi:hypothetical protein